MRVDSGTISQKDQPDSRHALLTVSSKARSLERRGLGLTHGQADSTAFLGGQHLRRLTLAQRLGCGLEGPEHLNLVDQP